MKAIINKTIFAVCIGLLSIPALGQDLRETYQKTVDRIFSGIPTEKITTGILIGRAPSFVYMCLNFNVLHLDIRKFDDNFAV